MFAAENEPTRSKKCNQITFDRRQIENTQISTSIKAKACAELAFLLAQIITDYQNVFRSTILISKLHAKDAKS